MKRKSIKFHILITAFTLTLFAIALPTFITSNLFINNLEKENVRKSIETFRQAETRILALLADVSNQAYDLRTNEHIIDYLIQDYVTTYDETLSQYQFIQEIKKTVKSTSDVSAVIFLDDNGIMAGSSVNMRYFGDSNDHAFYNQLQPLDLRSDTKWLGLINLSELIPPQKQVNPKIDTHMICGIKKYVYTLSKSPEAHTLYILVAVNESSLLSCFSHLEDDGGSVFLLDENGKALSGSFPIGETPEFYDNISDNTSNSFMFQYSDNSKAQIISYKINSLGWTLVKSIPKEIYTVTITSMWQIAILIGTITLLLVFILYSIWARNFCIPIAKLTTSIHELKNGDLTSRVPLSDNYSNEMYLVCQQFNELLDNVNELLVQKEWNERERAALEIKTLQSQITPHFIYNTLTSIRYMATISGAINVEQALITFSNIIKPIFSTWQSDWKLHNEIKFIQNYISLMRMRFGNLISITVDMDEKANICRIPRFVLQTLLENCCEHGFEGDQKLNIILKAIIKENMLYICIQDDGVGISEERLAEIQYNIRNNIFSSSIGLTNLDRRIKLFCGDDCGLDIKSTYHKGTEITIRMRVII